MTTADIDDMLRDLEKEVQDFTMSMTDQQVISSTPPIGASEKHHPHYTHKPTVSDDVPLQLYTVPNTPPPAPPPHVINMQYLDRPNNKDEGEEEVSLGRLLQRSATTRPRATHTENTAANYLQPSRSLKTSNGRDQIITKKTAGTETDNSAVHHSSLQPSISTSSTATSASSVSSSSHTIPPVPPIPASLSASSNAPFAAGSSLPTEAVDDELRLAMHRAWAVLDGQQPSTEKAENTKTATNGDVNPFLEDSAKSTVSSSFHQQQQQHHHHQQPHQNPSHGLHHSLSVRNHPSSTTTVSSNVKAVHTRIFINDAKTYKAVQLTNILTTAMVVQYLKRKGLIDSVSDDWSLFEIDNQRGVERPLREWEIPYSIINNWDPNTNNALLAKKYPYHYTLTSACLFEKKVQPMQGSVFIEYKKGKWQKKHCYIRDNALQYAKDNKGTNASILCHLASYDVYTLLQPLKTATPTPFVVAIRAQDKSNIFEHEGDYMRFLSFEDQEDMKNWVLSLRCAKSQIQYQYYPQRITNPLSPITINNNADDQRYLRRHKSTKDLKSSSSGFSRSESTRKSPENERSLARSNTTSRGAALGRSATTHTRMNDTSISTTIHGNGTDGGGTLIDCVEQSAFSKGSLLAKEETTEQLLYRQQQQELYEDLSSNSNTLIQIDDRIKFAKGSLLDKKESMSRSKSLRDVSSSVPNHHEEVGHRRHVSLRRKPTASSKRLQQQHHDVPLPNNAAIASLPSAPSGATNNHHHSSTSNASNGTLLRLDDTPEKNHSRQLHNRHVKPLLEF